MIKSTYLDAYGVIDKITPINDDNIYEIHARIYNIIDNEFIDEIIFLSNEFSITDRSLIMKNAIFQWNVYVEKYDNGENEYFSKFEIKRQFI